MNRQLNIIATDIQFIIFNLQICLPWLFTTKNAYITQCLLRLDGIILGGLFLTYFFCFVPESPYSSDTASSILLVAWYSNCCSAAIAPSQQWLQKLVFVQLHRSLDYSYSPKNCCCNGVLRLNTM